MPDDAIQVELGGDDQPVRSSGGPGGGKVVWLVVGLGLGFALSYLFSSSTGGAPVAEGDTTTTTTAPLVLGVGATIPGFPDGLNILVSPGEGRALEVLTWPLQGEPFYRSIPLGDIDFSGDTAQFDASGQFLAATTALPDGMVLRGGRPNTFRVVASGVTGFSWHDSDPADLAWSTFEDGELQIWVSEDAGPGEVVARGVGLGDRVVAFGDWGFVVANPPTEVATQSHVIDASGAVMGTIDGWVVTSHKSGRLLVTDVDGASVVGVNDIETLFDLRTSGMDSVLIGAEFSPDGDRVALTGVTGLTIVELGDVTEAVSYPIRAGSDSISWSSDSRFVLVSTFRGVLVLDNETGETKRIFESDTTRAVAATPIGGP
ncbi:hypothetical protein BH23ACT4_BH23ACT4_13610 [soil metagenome]